MMKVSALGLKILFAGWKKHDQHIHHDWPSTGNYIVRKDVDALGDGRHDHQFDIVYAPKAKRLGRTLIDIHGGAYIYSYRENNFGYASVFADAGYDVVLLDYPHNSKRQGADEQIRVLAKQMSFLATHAADLELNGNEFGLIGDSAGGHFALLLAEAFCNPDIQKELGIDLGGIRINGAAVSSPVYDYLYAVHTDGLTSSGKRYMFGPDFKDDEVMKRISPRTYIEFLSLPLFINACRHDFIGEQSLMLREELKELGRDFTWCYIDTDDHNVDHVHNVTKISLPESKQVNEAIMAFFGPLFSKAN